ncbi:MAG: peptidoglycan glycosyltransferase, partial [Odoribacter sp.]|nr:peptidoglycan glycosyltransferase [Odoribacter sp.]
MKNQQKKNSKKKSKAKNKGRNIRLIKALLLLFLVGIASLTLFVYSVYSGLWGSLPDYAELRNIRNYEASELYSDDGELLGKYYIANRTNGNYNT